MPVNEPARCHDCGCLEGETHLPGCDMEYCPFCGGQLISCVCAYKLLGYAYDGNAPMSGLPQDVYENGLPDEQEEEFERLLGVKGRVPYIQYPNLCVYCGELWPEMFRVEDEEWFKYIQKNVRREMLCRRCYDLIKERIDAAAALRRRTP